MGHKKNYKYYKHEKGVIGLPRHVFNSEEYIYLSCGAKCLLNVLQSLYTPQRNGRLGLSHRKAMEALNISSHSTIQNYFNELIERRFIELAYEGNFKKGIAREWRLTYQPYNGKEPTNEWKI